MSENTGKSVLQADSLEASLTVGQLERSAAWYCDALGFALGRRRERAGQLLAISLRAGAVRMILLTQDDGAKGTERSNDPHALGCDGIPGARSGRIPSDYVVNVPRGRLSSRSGD